MSPTELIDAHLEDELDDDGHRQLEAWLLADPAHRRRFLRAVLDHRALLRLHAARVPRSGPVRRPRLRKSARRAPWLALAALLLLAVGAGLWLRPGAPATTTGPTVVEVRAGTLTRDGASRPVAPDDALRAGDRLAVGDGGGLAMRFPDGSRVQLTADSGAQVEDGRTGLRLARGALTAEVQPQRPGFPARFTAPGTTVTVIGTALEVATAEGETRVAVGHGRVAVQRDADGAAVEVGAGEECLVAATGPLRARPLGSPSGRVLAVGAGQPYADLAAVPDPAAGDVIEIHPGTYRGARRWPAAGTPLRPVVIRGVGHPLIDGGGRVLSGQGPMPRALLQIDGGCYVIEGLDLANGRNGELAAGIRSIGARSLTVRGCRISACDQGIDAIADELLIDGCELRGNGLPGSRTVTNALRLSGGTATIRGCVIDDTRNGVSLRASVARLRVEASRIGGGEEGEIVLLGPPAGDAAHAAALLGNLLVSRAGRTGNRTRFISIEGGTARVELVGDTCVAADPRVVFLAATGGTHEVRADSCIFAGSDAVAGPGIALSGSRDWFAPTAAIPAGITQRIPATGADPGFSAPETGDFRPRQRLPDSRPPDQPTPDQGDARLRWEPPAAAGGPCAPRAPGSWIGAFAPAPTASP
jgi:ferric-dicitrate binding protein FerR (iron transport regulator)